jgi:O-antigen ligase
VHRVGLLSLWTFVFCAPWENIVTISGVGTIGRAVGLAAGPLCLCAVALSGKVRINTFFILTCFYFIFSSLSILWSPYPDDVLLRIKTNFQLVILVFLVHQFASNYTDVRHFFLAYVFGSGVTALSTVHAFQTAPEMDLMYRRFAAAGFNENDAAVIMALAIPMAWHIALTARSWLYRCILAYVPLGFYAILLTGSRSGFVAAMIALSTPLFHLNRLPSGGKVALLAVLPLMGIGLLGIADSLIPEDTLARIGTLAEGRAEDDRGGLSGRVPIWATGLDMFAQSPLIGTGAGTFGEAMTAMYGRGKAPHNAFIATAAELGLVGLVLLLLVLWYLTKDVLALPVDERGTWCVLMVTLLLGLMTGSWVWYKQTWLLFALATACANRFIPMFPALNGAGVTLDAARARRERPRSRGTSVAVR